MQVIMALKYQKTFLYNLHLKAENSAKNEPILARIIILCKIFVYPAQKGD